jgi:hypothetical protein
MEQKPELTIPTHWATDLNVHHDPSQDADFHYHEVEEWLKVTQGEVSFYPAKSLVDPGTKPLVCGVNDVLRIPQGEVHRVVIGPAGVTYTMWTPVPSGSCFQRLLAPDLQELVARNLRLPEVENRYDAAGGNTTALAADDRQFLEDFVSAALTMHTLPGDVLDRQGYLGRRPGSSHRSPSDAVEVLHATSQPESVLLSTVVTTDQPAHVVNLRLFIKEDGHWRCRVWRNYRKS